MALRQKPAWGAYVDPPLREKVALVTGAAKGLGAAITDVLACDGAQIVLAGRDLEALEAHAAKLDAEYPQRENLVAPCDVTSEADVQALIGAAVERFGGLDILINTAGVIGPIETPAQDVSADDFRAVLDVNVLGTFLPCKFAIVLEVGGARTHAHARARIGTARHHGEHDLSERHPRRADDEDRQREGAPPRPDAGGRIRRVYGADRARALHRGLRRCPRRPLPRLRGRAERHRP